MAGYIGSKIAVTQVDGYNRTEADAEFVNDPDGAINVSNYDISFYEDTGTTPKFFWDASAESLGLNGAPSAWSNFNVVEFAGDVYVGSFTGGTIAGYLGTNNYYNGTNFIYSNSSYATRYQQVDGMHQFFTAPSGTAGSAITFSESMRIDSSGNVGIGNTSSGYVFTSGETRLAVGDGSEHAAIQIYSGTTKWGGLEFADDATNGTGQGRVAYYHPNNYMQFDTNGSERLRIDSGGQIFAGCTSTSGGVPNEDGVVIQGNGNVKFRVASNGNAANQYYSYLGVNVGSITVGTSSTNFNTSSDYRLKENVTPLDGAANRLAQIPVHRFNFIADPDTTVDGFLAHEVQAFVPEAITGEKDGLDADGNPVYQGIDQSKLVPLLTAALQEALQKIDALEARVAALEAV